MPAISAVEEIQQELLFALSGISTSFIYEQQSAIKEILSKSDVALLERITGVGKNYCTIKSFIDVNTNDSSNGYYMLKCVELMGKCLGPYMTTIAELASDQPCLSLIYSRIYPFDEMLNALLLVVQEISSVEKRGCVILETLDKHYNSTTREVQLVIEHIYQGVSEVLISHLQSWLLYGEITDTRKEFFIQKLPVNSQNPFECFSLCYPLLPSFIRPTVAENILTVGQTVLFLRSRPDDRYEASEEEVSIDLSGVTLKKGAEVVKRYKEACKAAPAEKWKLIEVNTEHVALLATRQLHFLAMVDGGLLQQVHNMKDVFLMGRGELFHEFATQTERTSKSAALDLNVVLRACARKVLLQENILERFSLEEIQSGEARHLNIKFSVPWPLELLFTPEVVGTYNDIFRFLMRLKEIQVKMVSAWLNDKRKRRLVACAKRRQLQQNLWFLVNNLQYYLQVDVLDSQYVTLEAAVTSSNNFEDIQIAHARFLANLVVQSFLSRSQDSVDIGNPVQLRLHAILSLCEEFCNLTKLHGDDEMPSDILEELTVKFDGSFQKLLALLDSLKERGSYIGCHHLSQLLLRLDFNRFFSSQV